ncbi:MAG TPA: alpha/beta hydrolase [Candidatus Solibacter sp.]|jgi:pimeloyl-ACP methyl ester carboxylesterase|nr:alpha/beta hydrolase [Candidatus Solibacter sp.]
MIRRDFLFGLAITGALAAGRRPLGEQTPSNLSLLSKGFAATTLDADSYFEVHGNPKGPAVFLTGPVFSRTLIPANVPLQTKIKEGYIRRLGDRYRLLMADYPHVGSKAKDGTLLTVEDVCKDLLSLADAGGMDRFAAVGYSFGGNAVLQLATRSPRVVALVVGGWPAIDGPYDILFQTTQKLQKESPDRPEIGRFVNYYKSLQNWQERAEVAKLACPKLNYIDTTDGEDTDFIGRFRRNKNALQKLGWDTEEVNSGHGHAGGLMPDVACPVIRAFLDKHFSGDQEVVR